MHITTSDVGRNDEFSLRILHGRNPQGAAYRYEIALDEDFTTKKKGK